MCVSDLTSKHLSELFSCILSVGLPFEKSVVGRAIRTIWFKNVNDQTGQCARKMAKRGNGDRE